MNKKINKIIFGYCLEIVVAFTFIVVSYVGIVSTNLKESTAIAKTNDDTSLNIQYLYEQQDFDIIAHEDILDIGTLSVRNPNKDTKSFQIEFIIYAEESDIKNLEITFGDIRIEEPIIEINPGEYRMLLKQVKLAGYKSFTSTLIIRGNPKVDSAFAYDFKIQENLSI